jgi:hypothetical protein
MRGCVIGLCTFMAAGLGGCGTRVPPIQDIGDDVAGQQLVNAIVYNITCDVQDGISYIYKHQLSTFLDNWGVQLTLNLTVEEKSSVNPSLSYLPTSMFTLGVDGTLSSEATRTEKINSYYTVKQLLKIGPCSNRENGPLLRANDLGLKAILFDSLAARNKGLMQFSDDPKGPLGTNVISHEVKFEVVLSGDITPAWVLKYVKIDPSSPVFSAKRDKTHDLVITLGPTDASGTAPSQAAAFSALASDIGVSISNNVKNLQLR